MIAIIDSGSTKTQWKICTNGRVVLSCQTIGLNPYFITKEEVVSIIKQNNGLFQYALDVEKIYFFGAGCGTQDKKNTISQALNVVFKNAKVHVDTDMVGASIALYGAESGIAAILGTGANSCIWNGTEIIQNAPSLGYVLGDEGSGAHLGLTLVKRYLHNQLPIQLKNDLENKYPLSRDIILENVYKKPFPNRYLAQFTYFLKENIQHQYTRFLVTGCFLEFFDRYIKYYDQFDGYKIGCVGSVAYHFKDVFLECAIASECEVVKIIADPMDELVTFYTNQ